MRKILTVLIVATSALLASCSSPYYPEYVPIISLGASTDNLLCEKEEGVVTLNVLSNVEYTATLQSGRDWLRFADFDSFTITGKGNDVIRFEHIANNHDKRVAYLVLSAQGYERVIKIKQACNPIFEDYLEIHPQDKAEKLTEKDNTRMILGAQKTENVTLRLRTSCLDHQIVCKSEHATGISNLKVENKVLSFDVNENTEGQPRLLNIELSYVDGWDEVKTLTFAVYQKHLYD